MRINDLRTANDCALQYGLKAILYGGPGTGKTPLINSIPNVVLLATEPGLLSMRGSTVPTFEAYSIEKIEEFFAWLKTPEANNFSSIAIDSVSQMAEIYLKHHLSNNRHGMKAYGDMSRDVYEHLEFLYYMKAKHIFLLAKQQTKDEGGGVLKKRPYFPGQELHVRVPHLYDQILHVGVANIPGQGQQRAITTQETFETNARDRSGKLNAIEPWANGLGEIINKVMN